MPRVSVVIRCYRQAALLPRAVASVAKQRFTDVEVVVVNDGSPDDTSAVCRALASEHRGLELHLVEQENRGPPGALNAGIAASRGELILPLDADDILHPAFLARTVQALDADPRVAVAFTDVLLFQEDGAVSRSAMGPFEASALAEHNRLVVTSLFRRATWAEAGGFSEEFVHGYEDWDFWLGCAERGVRAVHVPEALFFYRVTGGAGGARSTEVLRYEVQLRALLVRRHPGVYTPESRARAERILAESPLPPRHRPD